MNQRHLKMDHLSRKNGASENTTTLIAAGKATRRTRKKSSDSTARQSVPRLSWESRETASLITDKPLAPRQRLLPDLPSAFRKAEQDLLAMRNGGALQEIDAEDVLQEQVVRGTGEKELVPLADRIDHWDPAPPRRVHGAPPTQEPEGHYEEEEAPDPEEDDDTEEERRPETPAPQR